MRKMTNSFGRIGLAVLTVGCLTVAAEPLQDRSSASVRLSGTYEVDRSRGDDPQRTADSATRTLPADQRDRVYQSLRGRLEPPWWLSIDRDGRAVAIASSRGAHTAFDADGQSRRERGLDGRMVTTRAEVDDNRLRISTSGGSRDSDFTVTFESMNSGTVLRVTRRFDDSDLRQPVTLETYYRRTMAEPRRNLDGSTGEYDREFDLTSAPGPNAGVGAVPSGTRVVATLDTPLSMRTSQNGEPFTMTVRSPEGFRGARLGGFVSRVDARRASGNGNDMRLDFRTIEVRGRSSEIDADLNTIRLPDGTLLRIGAEGEAQDEDRADAAVRNGAIGAAVGAIVGAITAGRTGAMVGAVVGGAGGVILSQDHERLDMPRGTEVTLTTIGRPRQASR